MNYSAIKKHCQSLSAMSREVIDDFLLYYAAHRERLEPVMNSQLKKYRTSALRLKPAHINYLKSEFVCHRIFKENGLIKGYLEHAAIKALPDEQVAYLQHISRQPWRFSFAEVIGQPAENFFNMLDVMTGEEYLLFSPGMQETLGESSPLLWFNLISFNGKCYQTFGLIIPFSGFTMDDIFFFATEVNSNISDNEALMAEVERNPFPFFMLLAGSQIPLMVSRGFETYHHVSEDELSLSSTDALRDKFDVQWNKGVYKLALKNEAEFPHFAIAYYDEENEVLVRTALTSEGFSQLTKALVKKGLDLDDEADIVVSPGMVLTTRNILNRKIVLNRYEDLFETAEEESPELDKMNQFLGLALPIYNSGQNVNVKKLADQVGMDPEEAEMIWKQLKGNIDKKPGI
jgi:hypothetical protein